MLFELSPLITAPFLRNFVGAWIGAVGRTTLLIGISSGQIQIFERIIAESAIVTMQKLASNPDFWERATVVHRCNVKHPYCAYNYVHTCSQADSHVPFELLVDSTVTSPTTIDNYCLCKLGGTRVFQCLCMLLNLLGLTYTLHITVIYRCRRKSHREEELEVPMAKSKR